MTQTPNDPYDSPYQTGSETPASPYQADSPYQQESFGTPDPLAYGDATETAPQADVYGTPVDPYAPSTGTAYAPAGGYVTPEPVDYAYGSDAPSGTADVAKDEAANVKDTAQQQAGEVKDTAQQEAANVKDTAVQAGQQVAGVAKDEAKNVAAETATQARELFHQAAGEVSSQAGQQQQKVAGLLHSYARELGSMASSSQESGPLTDLAHEASRRGGEIAHWLENREPREVLDEVRSFARRRPVAFLVGAALVGVVAGRLTRGLAADARDAAEPQRAQLTTAPAVVDATPVSLTETDPYAQGGRFGDLASDDNVTGYSTPSLPTIPANDGRSL